MSLSKSRICDPTRFFSVLFAEADCLAKQMTIQKGRHIIESAENLIAYHNKQMDLLMIRLDQEKREIKAIEHGRNSNCPLSLSCLFVLIKV